MNRKRSALRSVLPLIPPVAMLLLCLAVSAKLGQQEFPLQQAQATTRPSLVLQRGHSLGVNCGTYSPDGTWLASGSNDNSIVIWQTSSGRELRSLTGHRGYVRSIAITHDGKFIASGSNDRSVRVWDVAKGVEKWNFTDHNAPVVSVVFSLDGKWLASGSLDKTIKIWDLSSGRGTQTLPNHTAPVSALAVSKSGQYLVSVAGPEMITWDSRTWRPKQTLRRDGTTFSAVAITDNELLIATGSSDGTVRLWPIESNREKFKGKHNSSSVLTLTFNSDSSLSAVHSDGGISTSDLGSGTLKRTLPGNPNRPQVVFATFSPNGSTYSSSDGSRVVSIQNSTTGEVALNLDTHSTAISSLAVSPDGRWFVAAAHDSSIRLWQVATGRELPRLKGHAGKVTTVAFSPDSNLIASGSRSGEVKIWDVNTNQLLFSLPSRAQGVNSIAFSPDGRSLAVVGMNPTAELWDITTKQSLPFTGHTKEITSVAFADGGNSLVTAGRDKSIRVWSTKTGAPSTTLENASEINSLAVSSNGETIAVGSVDGSIKVFNLKTPNSSQTLSGHSNEIYSVRFSSDSKYLVSGSRDHSAIIWDLATGTISKRLTGSLDAVTSLEYTKDGNWVLTGSDDGSILIWNVASGTLGATLVSMPNSDDWLVATPDGLFDGSPESWNLMLWRFNQETFNVVPVESYFNEFFSPGVLAELLANQNPKAINDIVLKDRRQPTIALKTSKSDNLRMANIEIDVATVDADQTHANDSGAKDLRLFRNGVLVRTWTGDVIRSGKSTTIRSPVPIVAGQNKFSAYVFNNDNIKSSDTNLVVHGDESLQRKGTAYLLLIGVNQYANSEYNLRYAVADVVEMDSVIKSQQEKLGRFDPVVTIPLVNSEATKENILLALDRLAGSNLATLSPTAPASLARIKPALPEDAIFVYFSGHGISADKKFYLVPHDLGYTGKRKELGTDGLQQILDHSVSDDELERALRPLDASRLLLVIDACYSGQAVESTEKRRGPMNTKGLAQLAYEKGIYVLTASQNFEVAYEAEIFKHSYLAYALLEEGLKKGDADSNNDGDIFLREWFDFANTRVPQLRKQRFIRKELVEEEEDDQKVQRPRVFYTREEGAKTFLIGKRSL